MDLQLKRTSTQNTNTQYSARKNEIMQKMQEIIVNNNSSIYLYSHSLDNPNAIYIIAYTQNDVNIINELITNYSQYILHETAVKSLEYLVRFNLISNFIELLKNKQITLIGDTYYQLLTIAAKYDSVNIFSYLAQNSLYQLDLIRANDNKLFCITCENGSINIFNILINELTTKEDLCCRNNYPLLIACKRNYITIVSELLKKNIYTNFNSQKNTMVIYSWIFYMAHTEIIDMFIVKNYINKNVLSGLDKYRFICIYIENGELDMFIRLMEIAELVKKTTIDDVEKYYAFNNDAINRLVKSNILYYICKHKREEFLTFIVNAFPLIKADVFCIDRCKLLNILCASNQLTMLQTIIEAYNIPNDVIVRQELILNAVSTNSVDVMNFLLENYKFDQSTISCNITLSATNRECFTEYLPFVVGDNVVVEKNKDQYISLNNDVITINKALFITRKALLIAIDKMYYNAIMNIIDALFPDNKINYDPLSAVYANIKTTLESIILTAISQNNIKFADDLLNKFAEYSLCADKNTIMLNEFYLGMI